MALGQGQWEDSQFSLEIGNSREIGGKKEEVKEEEEGTTQNSELH